MRIAPSLALALALLGSAAAPHAVAQEQKIVPKPQALYAQFRELMNEGKYDIAANFLQAFLDSNPTDADLLEIERKHGTTAFSGLRTVPRWSDDAATEKKTRGNVEEAIKRARAAGEKLLRDPARVQKYIRNLGASYEERVFAEQELKRTGDYAVPFMVDEIRSTRDRDVRDGILGTIPKLEAQTMAGWVAALDGMTPDLQYGILRAIANREDVLALQSNAQTDITPVLWRVLAQPAEQAPTLRAFAEQLLNVLKPGTKIASRLPEAELVAIARTFYDHTARFQGAKVNPDGTPTTLPLWVSVTTDPQNPRLMKVEDVPVGQAEEYYGLRYARWALDRKPDYEPAQGLILALAAERAIERAKLGSLAKLEPAAFRLLSDAPTPVLADLLSRGLNQKKTALAVAMLQVLGDRADKTVSPLLIKGLSYPDPTVQITAADALLRSPNPVPVEVRAKVVDILKRSLGTAEPASGPESKGKALIADPSKFRADNTGLLFRGLGYDVEVFTNGRDLLRRVARASDFDVLFIDYHTANPELIDLIGQLQGHPSTGNRPTFVVASPDKPRVPTYDQILVRFAALIAATENQPVPMPPPFVPDPRFTVEENAAAKKSNQENRDNQYRNTVRSRVDRLNRVITSTGLQATETQRLLMNLRIELVAYALLGAEFPFSADSAPGTVAHLTRLRRQLAEQPLSPAYGEGTASAEMLKLMERFEIDLAKVPAAKKKFDDLYSRADISDLDLPVETFRDAALEARLARTLKNYPTVRIVPEPFGRASLVADLEAAQINAGQAPREAADKKAAQKVALEWIRKMATGDLTGYDIKSLEPELREATRNDDLASDAIDAIARFGSADAQSALLTLALNTGKPLPLRIKAADAAIRHVQTNGKATAKSLTDPLIELSEKEADPLLRSKLLTLRGLLAFNPAEFVGKVKGYTPPLLPPPPMPKDAEPKKDPEPEPKKD
ncbi:HEAT repeat-containing protein OS=Singulisphaera acidiphila (strain ATCC BAA-1392 / DSM 18658 / VKM B-2454 / MOB10) GN=Sinac_0176 PE=4 SV=1 [Gemmataceae bacterium]|nr:HEAT repeat-containing protein OS=Singulisphaera acidiphila (strain ATCC BAA-1392 / DSM 18658 / VKM B-2454 / MOB10) GN=Sinac_0176 PE=4 SV=1 [Gemmataceae bacterium]VTU02742.1 HEAT repeat-containing protein OS=Singulisphaera acidiphila (strain ATCC BAA-1392 / DSM 18658 / VKM B-2454 / MOB10) GN=Sinac_0176 PE=4 SV=1 [Gemmataceae bacterium]